MPSALKSAEIPRNFAHDAARNAIFPRICVHYHLKVL